MRRPLDIGLLGLGSVAQGLLELWSERPDPRFRIRWATDSTGAVEAETGLDPARLLRAKRGNGISCCTDGRFHPGATPATVAHEVPVDIGVDLLPCNYDDASPALPILEGLLADGTSVVCAEKASIVLGFDRLRAAKEKGGASLRYSACVGGSVPFLPILEWISQAHTIRSVTGVLNATTTYVLTELEARRASPAEVLARARGLGILERDPRLDTEGFDLAAKAAIVHNSLFPTPIPWSQVTPVGIGPYLQHGRPVTPGTRLVARIERGAITIEARRLPMESPLRVYGLENALLVETPDAGELFVRGIGAGGRGTATNVYGDLVRVANALQGGDRPGTTHLPQSAVYTHV